jgi:predicted 2-oxoglutarate/Fe(II)-dependent dioxygenase YbiX
MLADGRAFTLDNFLTPSECEAWIATSEELGYKSEAPITTAFGFRNRPDIRNNARVIADRAEWASELWARFEPCAPRTKRTVPVGLNERFRFYRYDPGEKFAPHFDGYYQRPDALERSQWTLMIYLNEDFEGGETNLIEADVSIRPHTGMALAFLHRQLHEGAPVVEGRKYAIRTDVMYRRKPPVRWRG